MRTRELTAVAEPPARRVHQRVAWLCGAVLFLEGYDVAAAGNAIPSLVDAWKLRPALLTPALTAGNIGLLLGLLGVGLLGDRLRRRPLIICCVLEFGFFTLLSALVQSPLQLASLRFLTGLGLGGTLPLAMAIAADFAPRGSQGGFVILTNVGVPMGVTFGGLLASQLVRTFGWPAIFVAAGVLPIAVAPLLWAINLLSMLVIHFILLWMPAILHSGGQTPARAVLATAMYSLGAIAGPLITAPFVDNVGMERMLAWGLALGAFCVLSIGAFHLPYWLLLTVMSGAGIAGSCQGGINTLSCLAYPAAIRSTGAGWAMGAGRIGSIGGPLLGGLLLAFNLQAWSIFVAISIPALCVALLMAILGWLRRRQGRTI
jgi:MFS transporter, AAHS family, 4-hydroxybenzoate transporter